MQYKIKSILLFSLLSISFENKAQSYEGYIAGNLPVWIDLAAPVSGSLVNGTYFYKKGSGTEIQLIGTIAGDRMTLNEKNKEQKITGFFDCLVYTDSMIGLWKKPTGTSYSSVKLYKVNPIYKASAKIPSNEKLLLSTGITLESELKENTEEGGKKPKLTYTLAQRSILSTSFDWETMGAYSSMGTIHHTFDLTSGKEILLLKEISPDQLNKFKEKLKTYLQSEIDKSRKEFTDEEWIDAFGDKETYANSLKVKETPDDLFKEYYLKDGNLYIVISHYYGFPHVSQAMDLFGQMKMPFSELVIYLNGNSVLQNLK